MSKLSVYLKDLKALAQGLFKKEDSIKSSEKKFGDVEFSQVSTKTFKGGFSALEVLFVIIILGIIASIALPKITLTRNSAQAVAYQTDLQTIISGTQEYALINGFNVNNATPLWLMGYLHLSPTRWVVSGDSLKIGREGKEDLVNNCITISFDGINALHIRLHNASGTLSPMCEAILKHYPSSEINVPLSRAL
ncbi:prepilin-type N-terminal cleavage/methylation domain-containing protein [Helicobacter sp. 11S02629-2]|uniref:prepilin-type N-terminal cleavage/methylation domain-containing protein n=1 Tax=Helicobacter sp. 11S02629-2 TaxID=1476195 RepID=UPI000BA7AE97|nr:prepilin-type N-terminal cleavage/methylation domain-containing protein [Helicobacter sp. 11S02629-2]PAF45624.1 hypothetical protein BKH40_01720 [Helicobacter sp. 11S02629-2]